MNAPFDIMIGIIVTLLVLALLILWWSGQRETSEKIFQGSMLNGLLFVPTVKNNRKKGLETSLLLLITTFLITLIIIMLVFGIIKNDLISHFADLFRQKFWKATLT